MIFDGIVGSSGQKLGNHGPFVSKPKFSLDLLFVRLDDDPIFLLRPTFLADVGVEMVVPPLSALLADPSGKVLGDEAPILGSVCLDELQDQLIFLFGLQSL